MLQTISEAFTTKYAGYYKGVTRRHIRDKEIDRVLIIYRVEIASADFVGLAMTGPKISL